MTMSAGRFRPELLPSPALFYRNELRRMGRPNHRGWAHALCPFHPDKHPSLAVNLNTGGFYCFSCGEKGGDIVDFVMKRDGFSFKVAVQSLGAWDERRAVCPNQIRELREQRKAKQQANVARVIDERRRRLEARDWLHLLQRLYDQDNVRLAQLRRGSPEQFPGEQEAYWEFLSNCLPQIRSAEVEYLRLAEVKL